MHMNSHIGGRHTECTGVMTLDNQTDPESSMCMHQNNRCNMAYAASDSKQ